MRKVSIVNKKRKFSSKAEVYTSIWKQARGLMFQKPLKNNESLLFALRREVREPISMLFVFFPIDVVWIDKDGIIKHIARNVKPFTLIVDPPVKAKAILETKAHATTSLRVGDTLLNK